MASGFRGFLRCLTGAALCSVLVGTSSCLAAVKSPEASLSGTFGNASVPTFSSAPVQLTITGVGKTSASDVTRVKSLIDRYHLVTNDTHNVNMGSRVGIHLYLATSAKDYATALQMIGVNQTQASSLSNDTAGFTMGNSVVVPLFQNQDTPDLANTIGHEVTHALFNVNVGPLPSWLNEGLAVSDGMYAQSRVQGAKGYVVYARQMAAIVFDAVRNHQLVPLAVDESSVYNANYDVELQDWLAVQDLIQKYGYSSILAYFGRLKLGETDDAAFSNTFGLTFKQFNQQFTQLLQSAVANTKNSPRGTSLSLVYPKTFNLEVEIVQRGVKL